MHIRNRRQATTGYEHHTRQIRLRSVQLVHREIVAFKEISRHFQLRVQLNYAVDTEIGPWQNRVHGHLRQAEMGIDFAPTAFTFAKFLWTKESNIVPEFFGWKEGRNRKRNNQLRSIGVMILGTLHEPR